MTPSRPRRGRTTGREPSPSPADRMLEQVGPDFFDDAALAAALTVGEAPAPDVAALREARAVLALRTADEQWIYPTWQVADGGVLPGLGAVLVAFAGQPSWSVAVWLTTPHDDLDATSPAHWIAAGRDSGVVHALAAATAARWS